MTTYNGAAFLKQQLDSIFEQTRRPDELIVCDDRSTDETIDILNAYASKAEFPMRVEKNESRLGSTKNFEKAIGLCNGDIIALCDQDDIWHPQKIAATEQEFEADPDLGMVFTNGDLIDAEGQPLPGDLWRSFAFTKKRQRMLGGAAAFDLLLSWPFVTGATMAFRSDLRAVSMPFPDTSPTFVHDRWIAAMAGGFARVRFIDQRLIAYRLHAQQQIGVGKGPRLLRYLLPHLCSSDQVALAAMRERLEGDLPLEPRQGFLQALVLRQHHIAVRGRYPRNPIARLPRVVSELWSGRYSRYPRGTLHALKDLVVGTQ